MAPSNNLTKRQKELLEKTYFNPSHAGSFTSAQALRAGLLLKEKHPSKRKRRGVHVKVPSLSQIKKWLLEKTGPQYILNIDNTIL